MVNGSSPFRDTMSLRLHQDLVGPLRSDEVLADRPTQRYSTGILYPLDSTIEPEEDQDKDHLLVNEREDAASDPDISGVPLYAALKPSAAGLSFAVRAESVERNPIVEFSVECATYESFAIDDAGNETAGPPKDRSHERWRRAPHQTSVEIELVPEEMGKRVDLSGRGIEGMQLYVLVTPHSGLVTVTAVLCNLRERGDSAIFNEAQHFFQVELAARAVSGGWFAPRPSHQAETDDDSRSAALIYRDVKEYVVGHTCSAQAEFADSDGELTSLKTKWIPAVFVPSISDQGDEVFNSLRGNPMSRPLEASWLAEATGSDLVHGLEELVNAYQRWIEAEGQRVATLPSELRPQAMQHIVQCKQGADRMSEGVKAISDDATIRTAFQLAQRAMDMQFRWQRGSELVWRPFQLGFQLLVLASLANRSHSDRETMDLLWFPTGGGKTEAYLALTAFTVILRRLRAAESEDGGGVAVLMRYTLRLLTTQQFQRAAAMVCACELLRRQAESTPGGLPSMGKTPIGIGLWVGTAATPNTLKDAENSRADAPSTYMQLTNCPSCGEKLHWSVTRTESRVECRSNAAKCELAASGQELPIWTIDDEIYRHTPALLIGTIDKFAQIVRRLDTRSLFGIGTRNAPPDLIIQDELHLVSGPLGSIAGLYEVAIDELCRRDSVRPKVIGSTATIRRAEGQIRALFDRNTYQFPAPGLDASNSGFALVDENRPGRLYLGVSTVGRSATYMLQALTAALLQAANASNATPDERNYYWTLVVYFNSLRELGHALVLMQDDVPVSIDQVSSRRNEQARQISAPEELTSRIRSYEIRDMLDRLSVRPDDPEAIDLLLASNMISVGMDIPRLGLMVVNSQPKTMSEYIQATSRVGRGEVPGVIVTMYNSMRARDRSHYETFETWHRSLYRDIEASSVTPFASRAQDKALHAVLVALARHKVVGMERRPVLDDLRRPQVEKIASLIEERVARVDPSERVAVAQKLKRLIDQWASRPDLQSYWEDYDRKTSLLMSAEQYAAKADVDGGLDPEGARRALWPTPNSMREVDAGTPFVLRNALSVQEK